ncbi:hypothetical protein NDU88_002634 [Pleurodeles waltl]|uniref:Uncharacterized protein n=1 Tax=Pleurodeles waltl TaxID=8319 RepID=A0AAV7LEB2_PLEWA|nr:hypothetical protein NDU88_002634 [Pleurodeles waltl]
MEQGMSRSLSLMTVTCTSSRTDYTGPAKCIADSSGQGEPMRTSELEEGAEEAGSEDESLSEVCSEAGLDITNSR